MDMMQEIIHDLLDKVREGRYPCIGIFYAINGKMVLGRQTRKPIDPATHRVLAEFEGLLYEHRDMWEDVVKKQYPEIAEECRDDHKALPRGRVEVCSKLRGGLKFRITSCKCLETDSFKQQVTDLFYLRSWPVEWSWGTMNYSCKYCRNKESTSRKREI